MIYIISIIIILLSIIGLATICFFGFSIFTKWQDQKETDALFEREKGMK